ncbi:MAG: universal stress protein [Ktedonobacteraceae bacterium]
MFQRILVPLDGSLRAERALPVAARLAHAAHGTVVLLRVVAMPVDYVAYMMPPVASIEDVIDTDLSEAASYLNHVAQSPILKDISVEKKAIFGAVADTILSVAESSDIDLVIICSHGYTGLTRWALGSVAEKVVHHAPMPVLLLHEGGPVPGAPHLDAVRPLCVLVPLDGSVLAKAAIEPAAELISALAAPAQAKLHFTRVVQTTPTEAQGVKHEESEYRLHNARKYLETAVGHVREGLVAPIVAKLQLATSWSVAIENDVAGAIIRVAENGEDVKGVGVPGGCDVIALATHGRSGFQRWALGSVTERVLHATKLPVLIVRPAEKAAGGADSKHAAAAVQ